MAQAVERGITLVNGRGSVLIDEDGREYIDCSSGFGVAILGHHHPEVDAALRAQVDFLISAHQSVNTRSRERLLASLEGIFPSRLTNVCFCSSGAETVEVALKYARAATGRQKVVAMNRAYHGRTYGALSVTSGAHYREKFGEMVPGVSHIAYNDVEAARAAIDESVAAVIAEPIQGEAGVRIPDAGYLGELRSLCDAHGSLLILDEIQTAFRTGTPLAADVVPDIVCIAKSIANGLPLGLTLTTDAVAANVPRGAHSSTFAANPMSCAAGAATLGVLRNPAVLRRATELGAEFTEALRQLQSPLIREVRGRGLMVAVELKQPASPFLQQLQSDGVLALPSGPTVIRFLPSVLIEAEQLDQVVATFEQVLEAVQPRALVAAQ
jgi:acetylornithine/LysW-gamma-L-lysine aminotransferase